MSMKSLRCVAYLSHRSLLEWLTLSFSMQEGAYADVTVKLGLIKLIQKQFDVCEEACAFLHVVLRYFLT